MGFEAVLFDWDGTLLDSVPAAFKIYQIIMKKYKNATLSFSLYRSTFCADYHKYYGLSGIESDKWGEVDNLWVKLYDELEDGIPVFAGVKELIRYIHNKGLRIGLISNGSGARIRRELEEQGIAEFFDVVITQDEVDEFKPSPEGIGRALKILKLNPAKCLYVGDMVEDIRAGRGAGVKTAAVLTGVHSLEKLETEKPDYILKNVLDVKLLV